MDLPWSVLRLMCHSSLHNVTIRYVLTQVLILTNINSRQKMLQPPPSQTKIKIKHSALLHLIPKFFLIHPYQHVAD